MKSIPKTFKNIFIKERPKWKKINMKKVILYFVRINFSFKKILNIIKYSFVGLATEQYISIVGIVLQNKIAIIHTYSIFKRNLTLSWSNPLPQYSGHTLQSIPPFD